MTDTPEMVERVAKALAWTTLSELGQRSCTWPNDWSPGECAEFRCQARAAIEAMKTPTKRMIVEGWDYLPITPGGATGECATRVYENMIEAALEDPSHD
jgi:hypothetical protein